MSRQVGIGVAGEIEPGQRKRVFVDGRCVVVFNVDGAIYAIDDSCPHNGASLGNGQLEGPVLRCPAHGLRFDLRTGCTPGTGGLSLITFAVETVDSKLVLNPTPKTNPDQDQYIDWWNGGRVLLYDVKAQVDADYQFDYPKKVTTFGDQIVQCKTMNTGNASCLSPQLPQRKGRIRKIGYIRNSEMRILREECTTGPKKNGQRRCPS